MKKVNFIQLFQSTHTSYLKKVILMVASCCLTIIICMHAIQGYTWYHLSMQSHHYKTQKKSLESIILKREELQKSKQLLQEKITLFNQQKKDATIRYDQLKTLYHNPTHLLTTVTMKNKQFSLSLETQTIHQAHEYLKSLKAQPLIHKARIIHLNKHNAYYLVEIKGTFKPQTDDFTIPT